MGLRRASATSNRAQHGGNRANQAGEWGSRGRMKVDQVCGDRSIVRTTVREDRIGEGYTMDQRGGHVGKRKEGWIGE
jgi:hypothetical protein